MIQILDPTCQTHLMIGHVLAQRYQILEPLGRGGMGQTYVAIDQHLPGQKRCAVKRLHPAAKDPELIAIAKRLFFKEAEILEQLGSHPQIPKLLAYFEQDDQFFLVQELIEGYPLSHELPLGQRWSEAQVKGLVTEILTVLHFVHQHNVIHRDIKPDNLIRRQSDGKLVLIDFGAVKQIRDQQALKSEIMSQTVGIGTPGYMPAEQVNGKPRKSSDLYAVGIIGIQALTGLSPTQLRENPDDGELIWRDQADVSDGFATVLTQLTRNYFKFRYQSADEALQAIAPTTQTSPPPFGPTIPASSNTQPQPYPPPANIPQAPPPAVPPLPNLGQNLANPPTTPTLAVSPSGTDVYSPPNQHQGQATKPRRRFAILPIALGGGIIAVAIIGAVVALQWPFENVPPPIAPPSTPSDNGAQQLLQAKQEAEQTGNLGKAIELAQQVPDSSGAYEEAQSNIQTWQQDWQSQNATFEKAQTAFESQRWQDALDLAFALPQNPHWDEKADPIYFGAKAELDKQKPPLPSNGFPKASCGDPSPAKPFYRVYISGGSRLSSIRQNFCGDAYYRQSTNRLYFAAFDTSSAAGQFRRDISAHFSGVQIEEVQ